MPKAKRTQDLTLIGQISSISDEIDKAASTLTEMDAHAKNLEFLRMEFIQVIEGRSAQVADLLAKATTEHSQTVSLAKLRTLEKSASSALLKIQMKIQNENRLFTAIPNALKTRHETVKNSIGNIR